jgi:hypothetical protein
MSWKVFFEVIRSYFCQLKDEIGFSPLKLNKLVRNSRMNVVKLFEVNLKICLQQLDSDQLLIGHMDDTIIRKTGKNVSGTS